MDMHWYKFVFDRVTSPGMELQLQEIIFRSQDRTVLTISQAVNPGAGVPPARLWWYVQYNYGVSKHD